MAFRRRRAKRPTQEEIEFYRYLEEEHRRRRERPTTDEDWFRAAMHAAHGALSETGETFIIATAEGKDVESLSREYVSVLLLNHINYAIATLAIVENETLSKVLEDVRATVGSDEIFRRNIEERIANWAKLSGRR